MKAKGSCPCTSGRDYRSCCAPFHEGAEPKDPVSLMRSRFAAFALGDADYLWRTLHADHEDRGRPRAQVIAALKANARENKFMKLEILEHGGFDADGCALVRFRASIFRKGRDVSFVETSRFLHDGEGWRYLDGVVEPSRGG